MKKQQFCSNLVYLFILTAQLVCLFMRCRNSGLSICFLLLFSVCSGQRNNTWYFGNKAGISFNSSGVQPVPSPLQNSAMIAEEGCASISDTDGELLFYSNGNTVYNRLHQIMVNGDNIAGNTSGSQSSIIVPFPGNEDFFYLFTTDAIQNNFQNGYRYSIIDMTKNNGNGEVTSKNVLLWSSCTERLTAARHSNGVDVWLITNDNYSNVFRSWLITCNGFTATPVVSTAGVILDQYSLMNVGYMKVSPDGKQFCQTHVPFFSGEFPDPNFVQLFDFNNTTGTISNPRSVSSGTASFFACEYSPDSKLLYLTNPYRKKLYQAESTLSSVAAISASFISITTPQSNYGIQAAPDEKIYVFNTESSLGVISNPDSKGTGCQYEANKINLQPGAGLLGSPSFINDISNNVTNGFSFTITDSCTGKIQFNGYSNLQAPITWLWDLGDGNTSNLQNLIHTYNPSKRAYVVKLTITSTGGCSGVIKVSKRIVPAGIILSVDFNYFGGCDSGYLRLVNKDFFLQGGIGQYTWDFGDGTTSNETEPTHVYTRPDIYTVKLKYKSTTACLDDSISKIINMKTLTGGVRTSGDKTIFSGQTTQLFADGPGSIYQWSPATGLNNSFIARPLASPFADIVYKVTISNNGACSAEDSIRIKVVALNEVYVPTGFTPDNDGKNDFIRPILGAKFILKQFSIFNRWGERIYSTKKSNEGWNGKVNGIEQNPGAYVWVLKFITSTDGDIERKGTFILIR